MPSSAPQIPAERLADGVAALREWGGGWDNDNAEAAVTDVLEAAYPHLLAAFKERLLSDEGVEAVAKARFELDGPEDAHPQAWSLGISESIRQVRRDKARADLEAALASMESNGGMT